MALALLAIPVLAGCGDAAETGDGSVGERATPAERVAMTPRTGGAPAARPPYVRRPAHTPEPAAPLYDSAEWEPVIRDREACLARIARVAPEIPPEARASGIAFHCEVGPTMAIAKAMQQRVGRAITRIAECGDDGACIDAYQTVHAEVMAGSPDPDALIAGPEYSAREGLEN